MSFLQTFVTRYRMFMNIHHKQIITLNGHSAYFRLKLSKKFKNNSTALYTAYMANIMLSSNFSIRLW